MKTNVYVDGFNLYYGCLKDGPFRWLNIRALCQLLYPTHQIEKVTYCTALVKDRPPNLNQTSRQLTYIRALETLPDFEIIYGRFQPSQARRKRVTATATETYVQVHEIEEKGSDVNLATRLLVDGFRGNYETAVVVSNDSDLAEPIRVVVQELQLPVLIANPHPHPAWTLKKLGLPIKAIRQGPLSACQFPAVMMDANGPFTKPPTW